MITIEKKSHNIGETLNKPCMLKAAGPVLKKTYCKKLAKSLHSDCTIKTPFCSGETCIFGKSSYGLE